MEENIIHGYHISRWAVFLRLHIISKYVLKLSKDNGHENFMHYMAEGLLDVLPDIVSGKTVLGEFALSYSTKQKIMLYSKQHVEPFITSTSVNPPMMLLVMLEYLIGEKFKPLLMVTGDKEAVEFVDEFKRRANRPGDDISNRAYQKCIKIMHGILESHRISPLDLRKIDNYIEKYKVVLEARYNTDSHDIEHAKDVVKKALYYNTKHNLDIDKREIIVAGLFHDLYSNDNRKEHHNLGYEWIMSRTEEEITLGDYKKQKRIAMAIKEHRASYTGEYYSPLSELIATADREEPNLDKIITRSYNYIVENNPDMPHKEIMKKLHEHIKEKYSSDGYMKLTNMYVLEYANILKPMWTIIDSIKKGKSKIKIGKQKDKLKITIGRK